MTKQELTTLLRSVGVNENTVTTMENAYEMGYEQGVRDSVEQKRKTRQKKSSNERQS